MNIEFIITIITIIAGFLGIIKFLIDLTNRVTKLEVELRKEIAQMQIEMRKELNETNNAINDLKIEIVKLQHQFGIIETKQADLKTEINEVKTEVHELKTQTNERINQVETDNRTFIKEFFQSLESWMKRPTAL